MISWHCNRCWPMDCNCVLNILIECKCTPIETCDLHYKHWHTTFSGETI